MKIRNGFVSNSSTSSFICFGWNYELDNETEKLFLKEFYEYLDSIHYEYDEKDETFNEFLENNYLRGLAYHKNYSDEITVGERLAESMSIEELKEEIISFNANCMNPKHMYHIFNKYCGKPNFVVIAYEDR